MSRTVEQIMADELAYASQLNQCERCKLLQQRIDELSKGPYEAYKCRDHWHVGIGGLECSSATDEAMARKWAAEKNADLETRVNTQETKIHELESQIEELKLLLEQSKWTPEEDG